MSVDLFGMESVAGESVAASSWAKAVNAVNADVTRINICFITYEL